MGRMKQVMAMIFRWSEFIIRIAVPILAAIVMALKVIQPTIFDDHLIGIFTLTIISGLAISEGLSRFITLDYIKNKLDSFHNYDIPNQKLLEIAHSYGIIALAPRYTGQWIADIVEEIRNSNSNLDICAIALPSLLSEPRLKDAVLKHSERYDLRILLLDPNCPEADRRYNIEKPLRKTISDIVDTTEFLKNQMAHNKRIRLHLYSLPPMLSLYLTENTVFAEPYHFGKPEGIDGCIGGYVPMLKIRNNPDKIEDNPYAFFRQHFQYLWNDSRGGRVNLSIEVSDVDHESHLVLKNTNKFAIRMDGWTLAANGTQTCYMFESGFVWKEAEDLTIAFSEPPKVASKCIWNIDRLPSTSILTLSNAKGITVAQLSSQSCNC